MSEVFKLSGSIEIDVDAITKQLKEIQSEGDNTQQSLDDICKENISVNITDAVSDLQRLEGDAGNTQDSLKQIGDTNININVTNIISDLQRVESEADQVEDSLKNAFAIEGVSRITDAFSSVVDSIMNMGAETLELANNQAKLSASCETTGHSATWMQTQYSNLYSYLGDDMAVTNSILNFEKLGLSQKETTSLIDSSIAVWTAYGDSIPLEGLAESIDETIKVGQITGSLADALNWAGESEDEFNKKLSKCRSEQERSVLITKTLNKLYGETKEKYDELTENSRTYQKAQSSLEQSQMNLGQSMLPLNTAFTNLKSSLINAVIPSIKTFTPVIEGIIGGITFLTSKFNNLPQSIQVCITVLIGITGGLTALSGIIGMVSPIIGIFTNGWGLLVGAITKVVGFVPVLIGAIGSISAPVIVVIGVITALIAIGVALWKNWDTIKEKCKAFTSELSAGWKLFKSDVSRTFSELGKEISNAWNNIMNTINNIINKVKTTITNGFNAAKSTVNSVCSSISSTVSSKFNSVKNTISNAINNAKNIVSNGLNAIKRFFSNCKLNLPKIKLPHFSIKGKLSINPPSVPKLSVSWYKSGGIMTNPTVFGAIGNTLLAGGEAGHEAILPLDGFYKNLDEFLDKKLSNIQGSIYNVNFYFSDIKIQNEQDMEKLAKIIDQKLQQFVNRKTKLNGGVTIG